MLLHYITPDLNDLLSGLVCMELNMIVYKVIIRKLEKKLQQHVQCIHNGVKSDCVYCDYKATEKQNLRQHIQSVHNGV